MCYAEQLQEEYFVKILRDDNIKRIVINLLESDWGKDSGTDKDGRKWQKSVLNWRDS